MIEIDVTECPVCSRKGKYEGRVLIDGRGFYECPEKHQWQDMAEKPTTKGAFMFDLETLPKCTCRPSARPEDGSHLKGCPDA